MPPVSYSRHLHACVSHPAARGDLHREHRLAPLPESPEAIPFNPPSPPRLGIKKCRADKRARGRQTRARQRR